MAVTPATIRKLALGFPETDEHPHFHLRSFRVRKKIFATLDEEKRRLMVKLTLEDQSVFCLIDPAVISPVPGGWGRKGATYIELKKISKPVVADALETAYCSTSPAPVRKAYLASK